MVPHLSTVFPEGLSEQRGASRYAASWGLWLQISLAIIYRFARFEQLLKGELPGKLEECLK